MPRLSPAGVSGRLTLDWETMQVIRCESVGEVRAYANQSDRQRRREVTREQAQRGAATVYEVDLTYSILTGPGTSTPRTCVAFDLLAHRNYPFSAPHGFVVSRPLPWSPHVHPRNGMLCIGDIWRPARGKMLLAQLVTHVVRFLNFDEPDQPGYEGWNSAAIDYWRKTLKRRPFVADLKVPVLPDELSELAPQRLFRAAGSAKFKATPEHGSDPKQKRIKPAAEPSQFSPAIERRFGPARIRSAS